MMTYARTTIRKNVMTNLQTALQYIENAHHILTSAIEEERKLTVNERNQLFDYGLADVNIHKVKVANVKKSILSIVGNNGCRDLKVLEHSELA